MIRCLGEIRMLSHEFDDCITHSLNSEISNLNTLIAAIVYQFGNDHILVVDDNSIREATKFKDRLTYIQDVAVKSIILKLEHK